MNSPQSCLQLCQRVADGGGGHYVPPSGDVSMPRPQETVVSIAVGRGRASNVLKDLCLGVNTGYLQLLTRHVWRKRQSLSL